MRIFHEDAVQPTQEQIRAARAERPIQDAMKRAVEACIECDTNGIWDHMKNRPPTETCEEREVELAMEMSTTHGDVTYRIRLTIERPESAE
jgi:hypothetical protein